MLSGLLISTWLLRTIFSYLELTSLWQIKEYRWDRMRQFLSEQGGFRYFISRYQMVMGISLLGIFIIGRVDVLPVIAGTIFLAEIIQAAHCFFSGKLRRPKPTGKAILILGLSFLMSLLCLFGLMVISGWLVSADRLALALALLMLLDSDLNAIAVMVAGFMSSILKRRIFFRAQKKRLEIKDLIVIGVTGSFGKSSVKEFLSQILSSRYKVLKTEKNINTEIGVAKTLLEKLRPDHQVCVFEMGAYTKGEIRLLCQIARPTMGIFTGLNEQHVALFGSLDETFKAKWELMQSLPRNARAIINADVPALVNRIPKNTELALISCSLADPGMRDLQVFPDHLSFRYRDILFEAPVIGRFQAINILMSLAVAERLGTALLDLVPVVKTLVTPEKTLQLIPFDKGFILDDSYNVNPDGLRGAIDHLQLFQDCVKIIFFPGILELGERSPSIHVDLGQYIGKNVDYAFFHDPNFSEHLKKGALSAGLTRNYIHEHSDHEAMLLALQKIFEASPERHFVILFESRGAEAVMKDLRKG